MDKPVNSAIAFAPNSGRGGNTFLLESMPVESRSNSSGQIKNSISSGVRHEALVAVDNGQPTRRGMVSKSRKTGTTANVSRSKRSHTDRNSATVHGKPLRKQNSAVAQQNRVGSNTVSRNTRNSVKSTDVAQNPTTKVSPQTNTNANPIAPSASSIAKERSAMNTSLNTTLQEVMGKEGFVAPTDHRGYTAMIAKAMKKIKNPAQLETFKTKIEEAGKPFRLNFGVSRTVNGKQEALNCKATGSMSTLHQGEYKKIEAEFRSKSNTPNKTTGTPNKQNNQPVNGTQGTNVTPAQTPVPTPTPTPTPARTPATTPVQTTSPQQVPVNRTGTNNSIFPNPELIA